MNSNYKALKVGLYCWCFWVFLSAKLPKFQIKAVDSVKEECSGSLWNDRGPQVAMWTFWYAFWQAEFGLLVKAVICHAVVNRPSLVRKDTFPYSCVDSSAQLSNLYQASCFWMNVVFTLCFQETWLLFSLRVVSFFFHWSEWKFDGGRSHCCFLGKGPAI